MEQLYLESAMKFKDGTEFPPGTPVTVDWRIPSRPKVSFGNKSYTVSGFGMGKALAGYAPSDEEVREWVYDSICETPTGYSVEPDGHGPDGVPSWLLLLGLI